MVGKEYMLCLLEELGRFESLFSVFSCMGSRIGYMYGYSVTAKMAMKTPFMITVPQPHICDI